MKRNITKLIVNEADGSTAYLKIGKIIHEDLTIICSLFDAGDNLIEGKRVYSFDGANKDLPIDDLLFDEIEFIEGKRPTVPWDIKLIRLWMSKRQNKDEHGSVSIDDPYYYDGEDTKQNLLDKIKKEKEEQEKRNNIFTQQ